MSREWTASRIKLSTDEGPLEIDALCSGQLAVHRMVRGEGYTISLAASGLRMSWRWRVFASQEAACVVADQLLSSSFDWNLFFADARPDDLLHAFCSAHQAAEDRGAFLSDLTAPAGILPKSTTVLVGER